MPRLLTKRQHIHPARQSIADSQLRTIAVHHCTLRARYESIPLSIKRPLMTIDTETLEILTMGVPFEALIPYAIMLGVSLDPTSLLAYLN